MAGRNWESAQKINWATWRASCQTSIEKGNERIYTSYETREGAKFGCQEEDVKEHKSNDELQEARKELRDVRFNPKKNLLWKGFDYSNY